MNKEMIAFHLERLKNSSDMPFKEFSHAAKCLIGELFGALPRDEVMYLAGRLNSETDKHIDFCIYVMTSSHTEILMDNFFNNLFIGKIRNVEKYKKIYLEKLRGGDAD